MKELALAACVVMLLTCSGTTAAFAAGSTQSCTWRIERDFEEIHDLIPIKQQDLSHYDALKADLDAVLRECPADIYPVRLPKLPKLTGFILSQLDLAILAQDGAVVKKLVGRKSEPKRDNFGGAALHFAAHYGNPQILGILLDSGFSVHATDHLGFTPLMVAPGGVERHGENTKYLVEHGANIWHVTQAGNTPLDAAIVAEDLPAVRFLLRQGALRRKVAGEIPPATLARDMGNKEIIRLLAEYEKGGP